MAQEQFEIFMVECKILLLKAITHDGYIVTSNDNEAMHFNSEEEAESVIKIIPNTDPAFWGTRPHRPNNPK